MIRTEVRCSITGKQLSPSALRSRLGIELDDEEEPSLEGDGYALFSSDEVSNDFIPINTGIVEYLSRNISTIRSLGGDEILLHIDVFWKEQCNFELSPSLIEKLAKLGVPVSVSIVEDD